MSGSVTVIGGHSSIQGLTGLVTVPSGFTSPLTSVLQTLLTTASGAVSTSAANFANLDVAGQSGPQSVPGGTGSGVLVLSNQDSTNATTAGSASVSVNVPAGFDTLVVQAPGSETVVGSGGTFTALFGANSTVTFNDAGGSGSVFAAGGDVATLTGANDYFVGGTAGNNKVIANGGNVAITFAGSGNQLHDTAQNATVVSSGGDTLITSSSSGRAQISVTGNDTIQNAGSADTIAATGSGTFIGYFIGTAGGQMNFVNTSTGPSSIIAGLNGATGAISSQGSVTVSAGTGGGVYDGGISGNNSLVGGSGMVTLFAAGVNNYLYANSSVSGSAYNLLNAYSGSNDTLVASSHTNNNVFFAGTGTESMVSAGTGTQDFFVGTYGSETISGSTASTATNAFIFDQSSAQGGGTDAILNFKPGEGYINLGNGVTGVNIISFESLSGVHGGTQIDLNNGTTIKLFGVSASSFSHSIIGKTNF